MTESDLPKTGCICVVWSCRKCGKNVCGAWYWLPREQSELDADIRERRHLTLRLVPVGEEARLSRHAETCAIGKGELE